MTGNHSDRELNDSEQAFLAWFDSVTGKPMEQEQPPPAEEEDGGKHPAAGKAVDPSQGRSGGPYSVPRRPSAEQAFVEWTQNLETNPFWKGISRG